MHTETDGLGLFELVCAMMTRERNNRKAFLLLMRVDPSLLYFRETPYNMYCYYHRNMHLVVQFDKRENRILVAIPLT